MDKVHDLPNATTLDADCSSDASAPRRANGRFAPSHSGNPKGRPAKRKTSLKEDFDRVLDGKAPVSNPAFANLTFREGLVYSLCLQGYKDPRTALKILGFVSSLPPEPLPGDVETSDDSLGNFIERQFRQRQVRESKTATRSESADPAIDQGEGDAS